MKTTRDGIWNMVYDLIEEDYQEQICLYEGVKEYEDIVCDVITSIEGIAMMIENKIEEKSKYLIEDAKHDKEEAL